jgi:pimeloyl-ACP methyl ester carboxylesterase
MRADRLNVIGVSLGGFLIPSGLQMAEKLGVQVAHSIFVCTGATLQDVVEMNFDSRAPSALVSAVGHNLEQVFYLEDPRAHLPYLHGSFLVIRADQDQTIPADATAQVFASLPNPKTAVLVHGPHINTDQDAVITQVQNAFITWLAHEEGRPL